MGDMVRVGMALSRGVKGGSAWYGRAPDDCLLEKVNHCEDGVNIAAVKTLPGMVGAEWSIEYACSKGYFADAACFYVDKPVRVLSLSGVCHYMDYDKQVGGVYVPSKNKSGASAILMNSVGDADGLVVDDPTGSG